jgi:RNA polymerase sigma factor (TIGR02999 family)
VADIRGVSGRPSPAPREITGLLKAHHAGDPDAFHRLVPLVYDRLRAIARGQIARRGPRQTLTATALVHEAYMQLVDETGVDWQDRTHFFAICARAMRRILVDFARHRTAEKRGGGAIPVTLDPDSLAVSREADVVMAVDQALDRLGSIDERLARLVECRYFAGLTANETAQALGVSVRTVERDWLRARAWLQKELG